ncbi:MAG: hypothetical protein ACHBMF_08605 [Chromatiales bacterium]
MTHTSLATPSLFHRQVNGSAYREVLGNWYFDRPRRRRVVAAP